MLWIYTLISVFLVSAISLIGLVFFGLNDRFLRKILFFMVGFAAGALLGDAFFHIIPEATKNTGFTPASAWPILIGLVVFMILEKFISWHHCHKDSSEVCHHSFAYMSFIGDGLHNFIDGSIIAASYLADINLGVITTIAVVLHEIPQEVGDYAVLIHGGFSRMKAAFMNLLSALAAVIGALLVLVIGTSFNENANNFLLLFSAGGFIYIAAADLLPELNKEHRGGFLSFFELIFFLGGLGIMALLLFVE